MQPAHAPKAQSAGHGHRHGSGAREGHGAGETSTKLESKEAFSIYRIADSHAHIYPPKIARKATEAVGGFYGVPMAVEAGTAEALLKGGAKIEVERYLVCSVATTAEQVSPINTFIADECAAHTAFIGLGAYHPDIEDRERTLDEIAALGLRGVKIHPDFQRFDIDDDRMIPVYRSLCQRGMTILIHMGDDRYDFSAPQRLMNVLEEVPDLSCIAAHLGGYRRWEEACEMLGGKNIYFDCSSSLAFLGPEKAACLIRRYGTDRVLFGVDFPMWNHDEELERFLALGFTENENKAILYENFAGLFGLDV